MSEGGPSSSGASAAADAANGADSFDEQAIVAGMRAGDEQAYEQLVRSCVGPMRAVALRLLQNPDDADDAVQEAFLSAYRNFSSFRGDAKLTTWLHRIVVNVALGRLRRRKRRADAAERSDITDLLPRFLDNGYPTRTPEPWTQTAEALAERAEIREQVRRSIDKLPENYRTVLILRDLEELDTAESARLLEISPGTVKVRLHRARQALRNLLEQDLELTREP